MSDYQSEDGVDEQSEDGEMKSPKGGSPMQLSKDNAMFSMSDEEHEGTTDSLDIKPPQAMSYHHARTSRPTSRSNSSRRDKHADRESRRDHSSSHSHMSSKGEMQQQHRKGHHRVREHREHREERAREKRHSHRERREAAAAVIREVKHDEPRSLSESNRLKEKAADRVLEDLRERLLDKRREGRGENRPVESRDVRVENRVENRVEVRETRLDRGGDVRDVRTERNVDVRVDNREVRDGREIRVERSESVREIRVERPLEGRIEPRLAVEEREERRPEERRGDDRRERHRERRGEEEVGMPREKLERGERDVRRERLLEADREMVRQKEVYRRELEARRERRHLEKEKERTMREIVKKRERSRSRERKKIKLDQEATEKKENGNEPERMEMDVVNVSDDSDGTMEGHVDDDDAPAKDLEDTEEGEDEEEEGDDGEASTEESNEGESDSKTDTDEEVADTDDTAGGDTDEEKVASSRPHSVSDDDTDSFADKRQTEVQNGGTPSSSPKAEEEEEEDELPPYLPAVSGCRSVEEFQCLNRIEEGTYGVVYRARDRSNNEVVALKRLKMEKEKEGFPITSLREINTLLKAQHKNIVTVREIVVGSNMDKIFIVMDYVEHDLKSLMETMKQKKQVFIPGEVKCLMQQLLRAVSHLHDNWILHRDLKTSNLLLSHKGILKVGDFGLAREYGSPLKAYTPVVVTLWYRSPELLLNTKEYSTPIDLWSVGCIFAEFLSMEALFPGKSEVDQINRIFKDLGTPNEKVWPGYKQLPAVQKMNFTEYPGGQLRKRFGTMITELGMDLMNKFLTYDPTSRVTSDDALKHAYFDETPLSIDPAMFPTWPAKSELGHRKPGGQASPKPPPGGAGYKQLGDTDERVPDSEGFHMGVTENRRIVMGAGFSLKF